MPTDFLKQLKPLITENKKNSHRGFFAIPTVAGLNTVEELITIVWIMNIMEKA